MNRYEIKVTFTAKSDSMALAMMRMIQKFVNSICTKSVELYGETDHAYDVKNVDMGRPL